MDQQENNLNHPDQNVRQLFPDRVRTLLASQPNYLSITNILGREIVYQTPKDPGHLFDNYQEGGRILRIAQYNGRIYPGLDGNFVSALRNAWGDVDRHMNQKGNYLEQLRDIATSETTKQTGIEKQNRERAIQLLEEFGEIAREYKFEKMISGKVLGHGTLTAEEVELKRQFEILYTQATRTALDFPATTLLYMYEKGGLDWLWGITEQDTVEQAGHRNQGGRVADVDWAQW